MPDDPRALDRQPADLTPPLHSDVAAPPADHRSRMGRRLLGFGALLLLVAGLAIGVQQHYRQHLEVAAAAEEQRDFVPRVRVAAVLASPDINKVVLPATTTAFEAANIFARASGYVVQRDVDIGSRVKAGDLLALITAPELDHQIAQAQATLAQNQATLRQAQASRDLAQVTHDRDSSLVQKGWLTPQQGDTDRLTLEAQLGAVGVAQANIAAQQALIRVLSQQRDYLSVIAPFDGIVTQRNVDTGSLVQAGSTFMFTLMQSDVIRIQVYVPQDAAFGVAPGVDAVVRVPEMPDRTFPGKVTRIATALAPGTRTLLAEIDVPNADGALTPGVYCTVELHIPRKTPSVLVPADAVVFNGDGVQVAVAENGSAHFHKVTVVRDFGTEVEVRDGLKPGEEVILRPMVNLVDGRKVRPSPTQTSQN